MRIALVAAIVSAGSVAIAEDVAHDLAKARELEAALDYAGALRIVDQALARGGSDTFQYIELHLLGGKLAAGLDRAAEAEAHFARVLALRPDAALPDGTSPKITAPFAAAKAKSVPLVIRVTSVKGLVTLAPSADPLGLVSGIAVAVVDRAGAHRDVIDRRSPRIALPVGTTAIEVSALDADGHRIWSGPPPAEAIAVDTPRPVTIEERSLIARWPAWAIATGAFVAAGGASAWRVKVAQDEFDRSRGDPDRDFDELAAIEARGDRWALATNIAFGAAIVTGVVTTILVVRGSESAAVGVSATGSSASIGISGRF